MEKNRLELVDYLKGISIAAIVVYHLLTVFCGITGPLALAASFAGAGIHLFNLCSGFGLGLSQLRNPLKPMAFLRRRFWKIYLPYAIAITVSFALSGVIYQSQQPLRDYLSHIFLYKMFFEYRINSYGGHFWYISTILQFYLLFLPLMAVKKRFGSKKMLLMSVLLSFLWVTLTLLLDKGGSRVWTSCAVQYLWEFSLGVWLAERFMDRGAPEKLPPVGITVLCTGVSLGIFCVTSLMGGVWKAYNDPFALMAIIGIYFLLYRIKPLRRPFFWVSKFSFSWYLTHYLVFNAIFQLLPLGDVPLVMISLPASILFAWGFQKLTDRLTKKV